MVAVYPWQVWLVDLEPSVGYEQGGIRPTVVVSSAWRNSFPSETYHVIPITSRDRGLDHHVRLTSATAGLDRKSWARTDDVQTVSIKRFKSSAPFGTVSRTERDEICQWLSEMFAWPDQQ